MLVYWLMFAWPATLAFLNSGNPTVGRRLPPYILLFLVFAILIGLRYEVGGDWLTYKNYAEQASFQNLGSLFEDYEAGYAIITWVSNLLGWDVYGTMTFCGGVLMYGTIQFCRKFPDPWLGITAAVPYLIIVVGLGYVRQAAAIGFVLLALMNLELGSRWKFGVCMVLATMFHVSALVILPFLMITLVRRNILVLVPMVLGAIPAIYFLMGNRYDRMVNNYIGSEYNSSGTLVRIFMNIVPSVLFFIYRKKFHVSDIMRSIWTILSICSISLLGLFAVSPSSTVVDRFGLYLIPIQLFVFSYLPQAAANKPSDARLISLFSIIYFAAVQFTWLNYADTAFAWLPYRSLLTQ